jgi:hypothetical protein
MAKGSRSSGSEADALKQGQDAARSLGQTIKNLRDRGDVAGLRKLLALVETEVGLPPEACRPVLGEAESAARLAREQVGSELKALAREAGCEFNWAPPLVSFGCVTFEESSRGVWELQVMDVLPLEKVSTTSAEVLASRALHHIDSIESVLSRAMAHSDDVTAALEYLRAFNPGQEKFSANLLMVLCGYGRALKKHLSSADQPLVSTLSRAQFGFLLERIRELRGSMDDVPALKLEPAVQQATDQWWRYVSVPRDGSDPRRITHPIPIASISLVHDNR